MDQQLMVKQMVQFNKTAFDNSFRALKLVYEQNEKMAETFLAQATWLPEEGRKVIKDWLAAYGKGCDDFKKAVDETYAKVEDYFSTQS